MRPNDPLQPTVQIAWFATPDQEWQRPSCSLTSQDPAEKRLYLGVEDVTVKLAEIQAHGGPRVPPTSDHA